MFEYNQYFLGLLSSFSKEVSEEICSIKEHFSDNGAECRILKSSGHMGLCLTDTDGRKQKNSIEIMGRENLLIVMDGEIYNLPELAGELNINYSQSGTVSDVLISAYEAWGTELFSRLNGVYSLALWDMRKTKLYLVRDFHGAKSMYYHFDKKTGLTFASRLSAIFRRKSVTLCVEPASVQEYLRFLDITAPNTIYKNVFSLEPGYFLEFNGTDYKLEKMDFRIQDTSGLEFDEALEKFDYLLTRSVRRRFDSQKTGFFLSGGIDSSMLCTLGTKINKEQIEAFTVGFGIEGQNEVPVASKVAEFLRIKHHKLYFDINQYRMAFDTIVASIDSPFADPATVPTLLCFNHCRKYVDVAIDGTGADGLLGSMPPRYIRFALDYSSRLPINTRHKIASFLKNRSMLSGYAPLFDFDEPQELLIRWKGWSKREIDELCRCKCSFEHTTFYKVFWESLKLSPLELYSVILSNMPDDRLHEMSFLSNLTVRFPYWDNEFVSFVKSLQVNYKYRHGESKFILRKLLASYVPEPLWNMPKHGFNFPFETLLKMNDYELINIYLNENLLKQHGLFDIRMVSDYVRRYKSGDNLLRFKIWALVVFQAWYLRHRVVKK
jgi:asparagine synthase (glutamine-hydrolysing)